jgi:hypothetical protein
MFLAQKKLLRACNLAGKPVMVTRVVDTMTGAAGIAFKVGNIIGCITRGEHHDGWGGEGAE